MQLDTSALRSITDYYGFHKVRKGEKSLSILNPLTHTHTGFCLCDKHENIQMTGKVCSSVTDGLSVLIFLIGSYGEELVKKVFLSRTREKATQTN